MLTEKEEIGIKRAAMALIDMHLNNYKYEICDLVIRPSKGGNCQHFVISRFKDDDGNNKYLLSGIGPAVYEKDLVPAKESV
jgi:hypothetical protein